MEQGEKILISSNGVYESSWNIYCALVNLFLAHLHQSVSCELPRWGQTSLFCVSHFLSHGNLGQRGRQGSCHLQLPHSTQQGQGITALSSIHIHLLSYTLGNYVCPTQKHCLQNLMINLEKEGETFLEDIPKLERNFRKLPDRLQLENVFRGPLYSVGSSEGNSHNCRLHETGRILSAFGFLHFSLSSC